MASSLSHSYLEITMGAAIQGLVTNYGEGGGLQNGRGGGHVKFYPYEKGGQKKF